jgi:hypothetical protein
MVVAFAEGEVLPETRLRPLERRSVPKKVRVRKRLFSLTSRAAVVSHGAWSE